MAVVVYLDLEGTVSPWRGHDLSLGWSDITTYDTHLGQFSLSKEMGRALMQLPADICWLNSLASFCDVELGPLIDIPKGHQCLGSSPMRSKTDLIVLDQINNPRPFVWADDGEALLWERELDEALTNHEIQVPYFIPDIALGEGLSWWDVEEISEFATRQQQLARTAK